MYCNSINLFSLQVKNKPHDGVANLELGVVKNKKRPSCACTLLIQTNFTQKGEEWEEGRDPLGY
jgi:hypothetical protein